MAGPSQPSTLSAPAAAVREQLRRLAAGPLGNSPSLARFLQFVVEETLAGRGGQLKEYTVAVDGLGRPASFDPATDASVRVAARQLRFKLGEHYREGAIGSLDPIVIELPKGGYVPTFTSRAPVNATSRLDDASGPVIPEPATHHLGASPTPSESASIEPTAPPSHHGRRAAWPIAFIGVAGIAIAVALFPLAAPQDTRASSPAPVIAVLPFANLTGSPDEAYLSDGLSEEVTSLLARDPNTRVLARTSAWKFRDQPTDVREIGRQLGATHVIEGSVRRSGSRYRVAVQVNAVSDGQRVWAEQYEVDAPAAFGLYDTIARSVHEALSSRFAGANRALLVRRAPRDPAVHQLQLEGRYFWNQRTDSALRRAERAYRRAIELDSAYAPAWAGLAGVLATMEANHVTVPGASAVAALDAARRSLALDPATGDAWTVIGLMRGFHQWQWASADSAFRRAIQLSPNYATARSWYSNVLLARAEIDASLEQLEAARRLDPLSFPVAYGIAQANYYGRRSDDGLVAIERALALNPGNSWALLLKGKLLKGAGRTAEARTIFAQLKDSIELALLDERRRARDIPRLVAALPEDAKARSQFWIATHFAQIGMPDSAFAWLERAYAARQSDLSSIRVDPMIDPLKVDPRYDAMVRRVSLSP
jgi:TolB-like protein/cytochrome c-type biogenesis protein CcmH/NrfG